MDDDDMRRGKPSTHKAFDEATAILAGDALQARAFEVLAEPDTQSNAEARIELVQAFGHAVGARGMCGGQMIDMLGNNQDWSAEAIARMQALKTGRLIQFSAEAGAIMGRAGLHQRHLLSAYGRDVGAAFQIADDVLDVTATTDQLGKTAGRDVALHKSTYPALLGVEGARERAAALVSEARQALHGAGIRSDALEALARYAIERRS
jgi:farnesyl diphosphate synthase